MLASRSMLSTRSFPMPSSTRDLGRSIIAPRSFHRAQLVGRGLIFTVIWRAWEITCYEVIGASGDSRHSSSNTRLPFLDKNLHQLVLRNARRLSHSSTSLEHRLTEPSLLNHPFFTSAIHYQPPLAPVWALPIHKVRCSCF